LSLWHPNRKFPPLPHASKHLAGGEDQLFDQNLNTTNIVTFDEVKATTRMRVKGGRIPFSGWATGGFSYTDLPTTETTIDTVPITVEASYGFIIMIYVGTVEFDADATVWLGVYVDTSLQIKTEITGSVGEKNTFAMCYVAGRGNGSYDVILKGYTSAGSPNVEGEFIVMVFPNPA